MGFMRLMGFWQIRTLTGQIWWWNNRICEKHNLPRFSLYTSWNTISATAHCPACINLTKWNKMDLTRKNATWRWQWALPVAASPEGQTDRKRCIWAHRAICTGRLNEGNGNKPNNGQWHTVSYQVLKHRRLNSPWAYSPNIQICLWDNNWIL